MSGKPLQDDVCSVMTLELQSNLLQICHARKDEWGTEVQARLQTCIDLPAAEAIYHKACHNAFRKMQPSPTADTSDARCGGGRPIDSARHSIFEKLCDWLEVADEELYTLAELQDRMKEIGASDDVYSIKQLKRKLIEHYEDHIFFSEVSGKKNVICFRNMAQRIISNKWYNERENNFTDESHRIVIAAAK